MSERVIKRAKIIQGCITLPGDKSISHRAALISLLCTDSVEINNFADGDDCHRSLDAIGQLGAHIESENTTVKITPPTNGINNPTESIDCGNSGTTMRLLTGLLCGLKIPASLVGDESLSQRPMGRIVDPLVQMNAAIEMTEDKTAPLTIGANELIPIDYTLPVASAQVKSAILLAGLGSGAGAIVRENKFTRDHTERMIGNLGGDISVEDLTTKTVPDPHDPRKKVKLKPEEDYRRTIMLPTQGRLKGGVINIPGDVSTASFFIAAALLVPGSHLIIKSVGINPTRNAFITIIKQMGADISIKNRRDLSGEPVGDIEVTYSQLKPRKISGELIPNLIDEIPIISVLASFIKGTTIIREAAELRKKESDRIKSMAYNLNAMGVKVGEFPDGLAIEGGAEPGGAEIDSFGDHRIAMAFAVAGLAAHGHTVLKNGDVASISCPRFYDMLEGIRH